VETLGMSVLRPWMPVIGAGIVMVLLLLLGTHVGHLPADLPPLPHPVNFHRTDVADLGAELSAPLFAPSRSVAPLAEDATATPQTPPPLLSGVVLGGGRAVALVKSASGGDTRMLHAGDTVDGWMIVGIAARQIVVARDGAQQTVALAFGVKAAQTGGGDLPTDAGGHGTTAAPSFDGLSTVRRLGLPASNIPLGSPLAPPR